MTIHRLSLLKSLAVSVPTVWVASIVCFYLLAFRDGLLLRWLGSTLAYLVVGSAYPLVVAFPLSRLILTRRPAGFIVAFSISFLTAIVLMAAILALFPGIVGGYAAGILAISCLGFGISYYINRRAPCAVIGLSLACWTFIGDYLGYNARNLLGGLAGTMAYASVYSVFLGSGLGALLWHVQRAKSVAVAHES